MNLKKLKSLFRLGSKKQPEPPMTDMEHWIAGFTELLYIGLIVLVMLAVISFVFHLPI